jgi:predicted solute-binding protein
MQEDTRADIEMHRNTRILRLGYFERTNLAPLVYPINAGWVAPQSPWQVEIIADSPLALLDRTLRGELDAAFLPPAAVTAHDTQLVPLGGWGLACEGRVETAILLAPQRIDLLDGGNVAISPGARGTTAEHLLRILLTPYYGVSLNLRAPGDEAYNPKAARLLYGDEAAREAATRPTGWVAEDLGVAWFVLTGFPMVWDMLAAPRDLETRKPGAPAQIHELLRLSQRTAQEQQSAIIDEVAARLKTDKTRAKELFTRQRYTLGEAEQKGLARFLDLATRAGVMRET